MRLSIRFLLLLLPVLAAVVFAFNHLMVDLERRWALTDLYTQANLIFQSIQDPLYESVAQGKLRALHRIYKRIDSSEGLVGLQVCSNKGKIISRSPRFPRAIRCDWDPTEPTPKQAKLDSKVLSFDNRSYHRAVFPLFDEEGISKAYVLVLHDPAYLSARSDLSRRYTLFAFLGLGVLISLTVSYTHLTLPTR